MAEKLNQFFQTVCELSLETKGQGFYDITPKINAWLKKTDPQVALGIVNLYVKHTSCSLTINENADPRVLNDLADWMADIVPESRRYSHDDEGADDMPAHIRTALTAQTLSLSVDAGQLVLGTWQAVYLWEHRRRPHQRRVLCHLLGEPAAMETTSKTLNQQIQARHDPEAWAADGGIETEVDLLVDQLHDLADT